LHNIKQGMNPVDKPNWGPGIPIMHLPDRILTFLFI